MEEYADDVEWVGSYKPACKEVNDLQKRFNKFAKAIVTIRKEVIKGSEHEALVDYVDTFSFF